MSEKEPWKHIHFNVPKVFLKNFENAITRSLAHGCHDTTRTGALLKAMELYIDWVSKGCATREA
jgi:hypothetical protein